MSFSRRNLLAVPAAFAAAAMLGRNATTIAAEARVPLHRGNLRRTGEMPGPGPESGDIVERWSYDTGGPNSTSPILRPGSVITGGADGVHVVNAKNGALRWRYATGGPLTATPAFGSGIIAGGSGDGSIFALDPKSGELRWQIAAGAVVNCSPAIADGKVYIGDDNGVLRCLNAADGSEVWTLATGGSLRGAPSIAGDTLWCATVFPAIVFAVEIATGAIRWQQQLDGGASIDPLAVPGDLLLAPLAGERGGGPTTLEALDAATGAPRWTFTPTTPLFTPVAVSNQVAVIQTGDEVAALDTANGELLWSSGADACSPVINDGRVYIAMRSGLLDVRDLRTGAPFWSAPIGDAVDRTSPAIANGMVYVQEASGVLRAYGAPVAAKPTKEPTAPPEPTEPPAVTSPAALQGRLGGTLAEFAARWGASTDGAYSWNLRFGGIDFDVDCSIDRIAGVDRISYILLSANESIYGVNIRTALEETLAMAPSDTVVTAEEDNSSGSIISTVWTCWSDACASVGGSGVVYVKIDIGDGAWRIRYAMD